MDEDFWTGRRGATRTTAFRALVSIGLLVGAGAVALDRFSTKTSGTLAANHAAPAKVASFVLPRLEPVRPSPLPATSPYIGRVAYDAAQIDPAAAGGIVAASFEASAPLAADFAMSRAAETTPAADAPRVTLASLEEAPKDDAAKPALVEEAIAPETQPETRPEPETQPEAEPVPAITPPLLDIPLPLRRPPSLRASDENVGPPLGRRRLAALPPPTLAPSAPAAQSTFFDKLFGRPQMPAGALGYAAPEDGSVGTLGPGRPGYDRYTAIYDIAAHTVYLPDGTRLEAHSGLGTYHDDPRSVSLRMRGVTPPNLYDLTLRESIFHGVQALRLTPIGSGETYGRGGLLAHTFMLGPRGDSNGCVVFRNYQAFLEAYEKGSVRRLAVVASLN